jgi:hypothetical protein
VLKFYEEDFHQKISSVFVSEYVDAQGGRVFENLWSFNDSFAMEAKEFLVSDNYDAASLKNRLVYWEFKKQDWDNIVTEKSRASLSITFDTGLKGFFKASGTNCTKLKEILNEYIFSNFRM